MNWQSMRFRPRLPEKRKWSPVFLVGVGLGLLFALGAGIERRWFLAHAHRVEGRVLSLEADDATCIGRRGLRKFHDCTKFAALVEYPDGSVLRRISLSAGDAEGFGRSSRDAALKPGERVPMLHVAGTERAIRDNASRWGMAPLGLAFAAFLLLCAVLTRE